MNESKQKKQKTKTKRVLVCLFRLELPQRNYVDDLNEDATSLRCRRPFQGDGPSLEEEEKNSVKTR